MEQVDMSAAAVTARLRLVSELTKLCLSLKTAKIKKQPEADEEKNAAGENTITPLKNEP